MIYLIVAFDDQHLIGNNLSSNGIPWHNKEDLQHFKETTLNQTIVMGRTTFEAIGKPLPNRHTIVVSQQGFKYDKPNVSVCNDLIHLIKSYKQQNKDLYICGGASIYQQALPYVDEMIVSRIPGVHEGDTYFPDFSMLHFYCDKIKHYQTFNVEIYRRN